MLVRMRRDVRGTFNNIPAAGGDCISVRRGQMVTVDELQGLRMILNGEAQEGGGELGRAWQQPPPKELAKIRERIAALTPPDIRDQLRDRSRLDPQQREELTRRALNL